MWLITFYGVFSGVIARTVIPYIAELKKKPGLKWDSKYVVSAYIGFGLALFTAFIIYLQLEEQLGFWQSFTAAFTLQSLARSTQKALGFD